MFAIAWLVISRIIVLLIISNAANKYRINKTLWIVLSLVFGAWVLLAMNFAIAKSSVLDEVKFDFELEQDNDIK